MYVYMYIYICMSHLALFVRCVPLRYSPVAIIAPASQDGRAPSVPSTWTSAPVTPVETAASALTNRIATTVNAYRDTLVII